MTFNNLDKLRLILRTIDYIELQFSLARFFIDGVLTVSFVCAQLQCPTTFLQSGTDLLQLEIGHHNVQSTGIKQPSFLLGSSFDERPFWTAQRSKIECTKNRIRTLCQHFYHYWFSFCFPTASSRRFQWVSRGIAKQIK